MVNKKTKSVCAQDQDAAAEVTGERRGRRANRPYDEQLLVEMLAEGKKSYPEIATAIGISESMVGKIARGESRNDLTARARRMRGIHAQSLSHVAVGWAQSALQAHVRDGLEGKGETARRCREFIIKMAREYNVLDETFKHAEIKDAEEMLHNTRAVSEAFGERAMRKWEKDMLGG